VEQSKITNKLFHLTQKKLQNNQFLHIDKIVSQHLESQATETLLSLEKPHQPGKNIQIQG
jgi:hypothetical protein